MLIYNNVTKFFNKLKNYQLSVDKNNTFLTLKKN